MRNRGVTNDRRQRARAAAACLSAILIAGSLAGAAEAGDARSPDTQRVLRVSEVAAAIEPVAPWDPRGVQRLVRIDGDLYQTNAGSLYPVDPHRITVRLADGVPDWATLVDRATTAAPRTFEALATLVEIRTNTLGIVDLELPDDDGDPVDWVALVHRTGLVRYTEVATVGEYLAVPNDPRFDEQWGLDNTGQTGGLPGADVDAERAWDLETGDPSTVVAVLDSGTDIDHEDLAANVWNNPGETPGNGVDDDGNGFVDDHEGWDFDQNDNDPRSGNSHGTHVTGVVNAVGGNGVGIAGLAGGLGGGDGVRAMALKIGESGPVSSVIDDALIYATDNGADVITMSLSVGPSQAIDDALAYAYTTHDVFVDCASGNSGASVAYPATRPEVMAVAATNDDDARAFFSNPGPEVEVAAPGESILSTRIGDTYAYDDGTSFAAPLVGALAALVRSRNPALSAPDVRQILMDTAVDVDDPGFDVRTGHGRIDAYEALLRAASSNGLIRLGAVAYACAATVDVTVSDIDLAGSGSIVVTVRSDTEPAGESVTLFESGVGSGVFDGTIATDSGPAGADGVLQVTEADEIVAEYLDADDGQGGTNVLKTATASVDCSPPVVSNVAPVDLTDVTATLGWATDEPATSLVRYGLTAPPTTEVTRSGLFLDHAVGISGLTECTTYLYEVESTDERGHTVIDDNGGAYYTFETYRNLPETGPVPCRQAQVLLDREVYGCADTVTFQVVDVDLDTDPGAVETVDLLVTSSTETEGEWITLTELSVSNSRFEGTIALAGGAPTPGDGTIAVGPGDLVTGTYQDPDDGVTGPFTATGVASTDCVPPPISNVRLIQITATRGRIQWTSTEPSTSRVEFGPTPALGNVAEDLDLVTTHRIAISPFDECDRVYFRVLSTDAHGATAIADAGGEPFAFNTNLIGGKVWHENFETDTGWQLDGEWERGTPQGLGTNAADPDEAWSGSFVIGNDLSGSGSFLGDYEPSTSESARSPAFDTRQQRDLELIIRRRLGKASSDEVSIDVVTNGTDRAWTGTGTINDTTWIEQSIDIGAWADNKGSVELVFNLDSTGANHSFGWNIDEVIVKDSTQPDYVVCGGCAGTPGFRGVLSVVDPDPCGPGGLDLDWEAAASWGTGTAGTYDVYRGTDPAFVPSAANRVASGLTTTSWTDAGAPVGTPVWYVVRARNDEACGVDGGLEDGNLVRIGATETTSLSLPSPVGSTLGMSVVGGAHVRLEWAAAAGADHYVVRRATLEDFSDAVDLGTTTATVFEDASAVADPTDTFYRVRAIDACGREE